MSETELPTEPPESPFDDAEMVLYTTDAEEAEADPRTEWGKHLGLVSFSLWARFEDEEKEIPVYSASETGVWMSLSSEVYHPDPAEPLSDAFVQAVVNMVNEDVGEGWGDPTEETFEAMPDVEKQLFGSTRWTFLTMESPEAAMLIDWCQKRFGGDGDGGE